MKLRHILTAAAATFALATSTAAFARDYDTNHDGDYRHHEHDRNHRDNYRDNRDHRSSYGGYHNDRGYGRDNNRVYYHHDNDRNYYGHDRGYHTGFYRHRDYVDRDRVYYVIREHNYRYIGDPYWYQGAYVVRAYDPYGRLVLVRVDPYSGAWLGVMFRL